MSLNPTWRGLVSTLLVLAVAAALAAPAWSQPTPAQILGIRPKIDDAPYATPKAEECTVTITKNPAGYLLTDKNNMTVRKFYDADGDGKVETWSFYANDKEVYREQVVNLAKGVYSFRWMGAGGMKWGIGSVDAAQKARIEHWKMISAEEAAQEAFVALTTGDFDRMKPLFITPEEMQALGLPASERLALAKLQQGAAAKFQATRIGVKGLPQAKFSRLENAQPGSYPADTTGGTQDLIKARGIILFENPSAEKKHDLLHSSEIIQVGNAWRLTDVPTADVAAPPPNPAVADLIKKLGEPTPPPGQAGPWALKRIPILDELVKQSTSPADVENYTKQIVDTLQTATMEDDAACAKEFEKRCKQYAATPGQEALAAYGSYRLVIAKHQMRMRKIKTAPDYVETTKQYVEDLTKFVSEFPTSEDAPSARMEGAGNYELLGKDKEAKDWYSQIVAKMPNTPQGQKAAGAVRRLDSVGQPFDLVGTTISQKPFDIKAPRGGKVTIVYYWASFSGETIVAEFARLKKLQEDFPKDLDIVCVNLDEKDAAAAVAPILAKAPPTATHLVQPAGGLNGPLAIQYGFYTYPHIFLLDRDGKVALNRANIGVLEEEIQKLTKK